MLYEVITVQRRGWARIGPAAHASVFGGKERPAAYRATGKAGAYGFPIIPLFKTAVANGNTRFIV